MQTWVCPIKIGMDHLGLYSVFVEYGWNENWILRCADFAGDHDPWTTEIRNVQEVDLSSRRSWSHKSKSKSCKFSC